MLPETFYKLGIMGWPLLGCSILATMIILERVAFILTTSFNNGQLLKDISAILWSHKHQPRNLRDEIVTLELGKARAPYDRGLVMLRLIAALAPLCGLLGTILGIIEAFRVIAVTTNPVTPNMIADGLWEALLTTAIGLMIALPAVIVSSFLTAWRNKVLGSTLSSLNAQSINFDLEYFENNNLENIRSPNRVAS
ncbi:hypothetical protein A9Q83_18530 [Alphaproteobacteria bacterium 46_93_T64]|nr:hypothetical protein A9Q83_18530 [Alphaproteobacteria bacterium 46_93_T64]